jgi:hypothetical protein
MKLTNMILAATAAVALAAPAFAAHGPFSAPDGKTPGGFAPLGTNMAAPATREPGENGRIAREAEKGNPNEDGTNDVIDAGEGSTGGGLFPGQSGTFPGGRE